MSVIAAQNGISIAVPHQNIVPQPYFPSEMDWKLMLNWGASALKSGMLPSSIKSPEAAAIIALKGRELGIPFMQAIAHIHVINGKPSISAELQVVLAKRNIAGLKLEPIELNENKATIEFSRPGHKPMTFTFTMDEARKADLTSKDNWKKWPRSMLWARASSMGLKIFCPEGLMGMSQTPDELGAETDEQGNYLETTGRKVTSQPQSASFPGPEEDNPANYIPKVIQPKVPVDDTYLVGHPDDVKLNQDGIKILDKIERQKRHVINPQRNSREDKLTDTERKMLIGLLKKCDTTVEQFTEYCKSHLQVTSSADIAIKNLDALIYAINSGFVNGKPNALLDAPVYEMNEKPIQFFKHAHPGVPIAPTSNVLPKEDLAWGKDSNEPKESFLS